MRQDWSRRNSWKGRVGEGASWEGCGVGRRRYRSHFCFRAASWPLMHPRASASFFLVVGCACGRSRPNSRCWLEPGPSWRPSWRRCGHLTFYFVAVCFMVARASGPAFSIYVIAPSVWRSKNSLVQVPSPCVFGVRHVSSVTMDEVITFRRFCQGSSDASWMTRPTSRKTCRIVIFAFAPVLCRPRVSERVRGKGIEWLVGALHQLKSEFAIA